MPRRTALACGLLILPLASIAAERTPGANVNLTAGPERTQALHDAIARADAAFFAAFFDSCDVDAVAAMVSDDFEFFHDKGGLTATSGAQFVEVMKGKCARQTSGEDFLSRRELVPESLEVYPLANYGAVQVGVHRFYAIVAGQPDRLTETARFTQVWKQEGETWKLARVLSYDHRLAEPPAEAKR